jgi:hypothetical protein
MTRRFCTWSRPCLTTHFGANTLFGDSAGERFFRSINRVYLLQTCLPRLIQRMQGVRGALSGSQRTQEGRGGAGASGVSHLFQEGDARQGHPDQGGHSPFYQWQS